MMPMNPDSQTKQPTNIMVYVGGLIVCGLVVYFSFTAVNSLGLEEQTAIVIGKGYHAAGETYATQRDEVPKPISGIAGIYSLKRLIE